jgi:hypothetical protein
MMTIKKFTAYSLFIFIFYSCGNNKKAKQEADDYFVEDHPIQGFRTKYFGVSLEKYLPMGWIYVDSAKEQYAYRYIRTIISNDSTIPVHLKIVFPESYIAMTPSEKRKYKAFILPDSMTAEKQFDNSANNMGFCKESKFFLNKESAKYITLEKTLLPKEKCELRIGLLFLPCDGVTRIELFSRGHKHNLRLPAIAFDLNNPSAKKLDLFLGATYNSSYSSIKCGELFY